METTNGFCPNIRDTVNVLINCPLPVSFLDFTGNCSNTDVVLSWHTGSETNNSYFTIYRAGSGLEFTPLMIVPGGGNKSGVQHYQFTDTKPMSGINYYKLSQTDFDGHTTELKTISVFNNCKNLMAEPFSAYFVNQDQLILIHHFNLHEDVLLELADVTGKLVFEQKLIIDDEYSKATLLLNKILSSGVYFLRASSNGVTHTAKVIAY